MKLAAMEAEDSMTPSVTEGPGDVEEPTFGPSGYLPPQASRRARKIVMREQMGLFWPIAAVVAGVVILALTIPFVLTHGDPPGPPFVATVPIDDVPAHGEAVLSLPNSTATVVVVRGSGTLLAFWDAPADARWCAASGRIEDPNGTVWSSQGRRLSAAGESLQPTEVVAVDDVLYVSTDPGAALPPSTSSSAAPEC